MKYDMNRIFIEMMRIFHSTSITGPTTATASISTLAPSGRAATW